MSRGDSEGSEPLPLRCGGAGLSLPEAATAYARAGVPIFPCVRGEKRPLTGHGFHDATTDLRTVEAWWYRWPRANIGIATGQRYDVIDIDVRSNGSGFPAINRAQRAGLVRGWATIVATPSGGRHIYYPADGSNPQACWSLGELHLDFRGVGGYVVAPPSMLLIDGDLRPYVASVFSPVPAVPIDAAAVREFLAPTPPSARSAARPAELAFDVAHLADWLAEQQEGNRNNALFWAACRCVEGHLSESEAIAALAGPADRIGLQARESAATIRSAYRTARPAKKDGVGPDPLDNMDIAL